MTQKINTWLDELNMLCDIARIEPQIAYSYFVSGYKHKLPYIMRANPNISPLEKIDELILTKLIPAIKSGIHVYPGERHLSNYPQNMVVSVSQYFQSLQVLNLKTLKSCQTNYETKLLKKNEQQSTTRRVKENKNNIRNSKQARHR